MCAAEPHAAAEASDYPEEQPVVIVDSLPPPPASASDGGSTNQMWSVVSGMLSVLLLTMGASWWWWLKSRRKLRHETAKMREYLDDAASYRSAGTKVLNSHTQPHAHTLVAGVSLRAASWLLAFKAN
jgi:hypothetical protein